METLIAQIAQNQIIFGCTCTRWSSIARQYCSLWWWNIRTHEWLSETSFFTFTPLYFYLVQNLVHFRSSHCFWIVLSSLSDSVKQLIRKSLHVYVTGKFDFKKNISLMICRVFSGFIYYIYIPKMTASLGTDNRLDTELTAEVAKPGSLLPKFQEERRWTGGCRSQRTNHSWSSGQYLSALLWLGTDFQSLSSLSRGRSEIAAW